MTRTEQKRRITFFPTSGEGVRVEPYGVAVREARIYEDLPFVNFPHSVGGDCNRWNTKGQKEITIVDYVHAIAIRKSERQGCDGKIIQIWREGL